MTESIEHRVTVFPHPSGFYLECRCGDFEKFVAARSADEQTAGKPSALDIAGQHDGRDHSGDLTHPAPAFYAEVDPEDLDDHGTARIRIRTMEIDGEVEIIGYPADDDPATADANMHRELRAAGYTIIDSGRLNPVNRRTITYPVALAYQGPDRMLP
jgi:hypothetical protein